MTWLTNLDVRYARDGVHAKLLADLRYEGKYDEFLVPAGYVTDFATVPWFVQWLLPKQGKWTRPAILHDRNCDENNAFYAAALSLAGHEMSDRQAHAFARGMVADPKNTDLYDRNLHVYVPRPAAGPVDTDGVFRRTVREEGTDPISTELLWMGVRLGALANAARRPGWLRTAPRVLADLAAVVAVLAGLVALLAVVL